MKNRNPSYVSVTFLSCGKSSQLSHPSFYIFYIVKFICDFLLNFNQTLNCQSANRNTSLLSCMIGQHPSVACTKVFLYDTKF